MTRNESQKGREWRGSYCDWDILCHPGDDESEAGGEDEQEDEQEEVEGEAAEEEAAEMEGDVHGRK